MQCDRIYNGAPADWKPDHYDASTRLELHLIELCAADSRQVLRSAADPWHAGSASPFPMKRDEETEKHAMEDSTERIFREIGKSALTGRIIEADGSVAAAP